MAGATPLRRRGLRRAEQVADRIHAALRPRGRPQRAETAAAETRFAG